MTPEVLQKLVQKALTTLEGDWIIIGGTVLPLVDKYYRVTVDIDMIPIHDGGNESLLSLMELASSLGLPVESINSAGLFFLKKIPDWKKRVEVHAQSKKCRILRPTFDLYLELKISRLSESDMQDIETYLAWHRENKKAVNIERSKRTLEKSLNSSKQDKIRFENIKGLMKRLGLKDEPT